MKYLLWEHTIKYELIAVLNYLKDIFILANLFLEDWGYKDLSNMLTVPAWKARALFRSALLSCLQNTLHSVLIQFTSSVCAGIPALSDHTINSQVSYRNERWRNDRLSLLKNFICNYYSVFDWDGNCVTVSWELFEFPLFKNQFSLMSGGFKQWNLLGLFHITSCTLFNLSVGR